MPYLAAKPTPFWMVSPHRTLKIISMKTDIEKVCIFRHV